MSAPIHFDKYVFHKGEVIPENLDLRGAIAVNRDYKHQTILHIIFFVAQKIHNFLFQRNDEVNMAHWSIILEKDQHSPHSYYTSHAYFPYIQRDHRSYLDPNSENSGDVTEMVIYIPRNPVLREQIVQSARDTTANEKQKSRFSIGDIIRSFFNKPSLRPTKRTMRRTALATADLLQQHEIRNRRNAPRSLFCTPYATFITQSSILMNSLTNLERENLKTLSRDELAKHIYKRIKKQNSQDDLSGAFWQNPMCRLNCRFSMSSFAATVMDSQSQVIRT